MDKDPYLHISPFNIVAKCTRTSTENVPVFLQCGRHKKIGTTLGLSLPDLSVNCSDFCNQVTHFLYAKLTELGAEDLSSRVLTADAISEATQYNFNIENLTVTTKHVRLPSNDEDLTGIYGLENVGIYCQLIPD